MMQKLSIGKQQQIRRHQFFKPSCESLERREVMSGFQTLEPAYVVASAPSVQITPLVTVGDTVADNYGADDLADYRMVGIPDGLGAFDNGDGTFTVVMNHEIGNTQGIVRDHGSKGSFVSRWVIDKNSLEVLEGDDLIKTVYVWDSGTNSFVVGSAALAAMTRLCSADLPDVTAFYNSATGLGTQNRIFMNGEETSNGRAFAHVINGPEAGTSWELPWTGKYAWENHVASPYAQDKTIVMGLDDSRREFSSEGSAEPSEVYVWIGQKQSTGLEIEKAGLRTGVLNGIRVGLPGSYDANEGTVVSGERFELVPLSDQTNNATFAPLQTESIANTITQFRRVEDGHFDPTNPNVFYFVTTDNFGGSTRLWKMTFDDILNPEAGGVIEIAFDSPASVAGEMFDNMTVNYDGDVLLQEDPGGNPYLAKIWQWDAATGDLIQVAQHNPALFGAAGLDLYAGIPGVQGTVDEESSGIIDLSHILGEGYYLADVQAHYNFTATTDPSGELVQAGQLFIMQVPPASAALEDGVLMIEGSVEQDDIFVDEVGAYLAVYRNGELLGQFKKSNVDLIVVNGGAGNDRIELDHTIAIDSILSGGLGNDVLYGANGRDRLLGGDGDDELYGRNNKDYLDGGDGNDWLYGGNGVDSLLNGEQNSQ
jgi:hypothetical protein